MTGREALEYEEKRTYLYNKAGGYCEVCGKPVGFNTFHWAHRIPQNDMNLKKYGKEVIHHPLNAAVTCGLYCNGRVSIRNHELCIEKLVYKIQEELNGE